MNKKKIEIIKKEKQILFVNYNAFPCAVGGAEIFNYYLVNRLSNMYQVHVITYCEESRYDPEVVVHKIKKFNFFKKYFGPIQTFAFLMNNRSIKFIHVTFSTASWFHWFSFFMMHKLLNVQYMVTVHGGELAQWNTKRTFAYKLFFKKAFKISGVSERIINEYKIRTKRDDLVFTPPLVPFNIIKPKNKFRDKWGVDLDDFVILYVGSLKPLKSVHTLIDALGLLSFEKIREFNLKVLIAGDGISKADLEKRVIDLKLHKYVKFLGLVDTKNISELYNLADIYTICSNYEGLPISTLEAFANNLPCITSDAPGLINISMQNQNTLLFQTGDSEDYARKIETLLHNTELQNKLIVNGNNYYKNLYSYDNLINIFTKIIDEV